ncbi:MAG: hypothetical protein A2091_01605 [Desulfuromonadales bacterium GWD2_61_12]|nr:MAG: hypothetical protein A2091_01605 [Desulfuromonadales bacterium GWD2_61_12]HBT83390.1 hypothetical protein [Desulfuromonas sp.]
MEDFEDRRLGHGGLRFSHIVADLRYRVNVALSARHLDRGADPLQVAGRQLAQLDEVGGQVFDIRKISGSLLVAAPQCL